MPQSINSFVTGAFLTEPCTQPPASAAELCFESIFQAAAIGIAICQTDGRVLRSNPALDQMLGYGREELTGMNIRDFLSSEDATQDAARLCELLSGEKSHYRVERQYFRKDNKPLWGRHTASIVGAKTNKPMAVVETIEDITDYKQAQEQLIEAQKMEAIGRLVGGVAHDFNNLLTGIMLYCDLLSAEIREDGRLRRNVSEIQMAAQHGSALVQQLLTVARKHVVEPKILCLNETIAVMSNLLERLIGEQIALTLDLERELWSVLLDPTQAQQVLLNLVLNAKDAMPQGGRLVITTRNCEQPSRAQGQKRRVVSLVVADTGCGMDPETQARLFEPFFTTKEVGKGNGLGLATVYRIVRDGGGTILVESEVGLGSKIEIALPGVIEGEDSQSELSGTSHNGSDKR